MPRHSPCALCHLTLMRWFTHLRFPASVRYSRLFFRIVYLKNCRLTQLDFASLHLARFGALCGRPAGPTSKLAARPFHPRNSCDFRVKLIFLSSFLDVFLSSICSFQGAIYRNRFRLLSERSFGSRLLSHTVSSIVPSAAYGLTVVFGMGTGVSRKRITTKTFSLSP